MKTNSSNPQAPVQTLATITLDTDPANPTPYVLTIQTPSGPKTFEFARIIESIHLAQFINTHVRLSFEVLPA